MRFQLTELAYKARSVDLPVPAPGEPVADVVAGGRVTRASGRSIPITHRRIKNDRLAAAGFVWAFIAISNSPGARRHYDRRREHGDRHATALRHLFNRYLGCLHHCLTNRKPYDENVAFPAQIEAPA
jgi:hypothetical protein